MSGVAADQLLRSHAPGDLDAPVRDQRVAVAGGNSLALIELAEVLSSDQLADLRPDRDSNAGPTA